jgi:hypothetical protein
MPGHDVTINRKIGKTTGVAVTNAIATCAAVDNRNSDAIGIWLTAHATAASLAIYVSTTIDGTFVPLLTTGNVAEAVTVDAASKAYTLPITARPWPFLKFLANAGTATLTVVRKS